MNDSVISTQWERLCSLIAPAGGQVSDRMLLDFARNHLLNDAQKVNLFQLRAGMEEIDYTTVVQLCRIYSTVQADWLLGVSGRTAPPGRCGLEGNWRLKSVKSWQNGWHLSPGKQWGPRVLVFREDQTVEIVRLHSVLQEKY